MYTYERYNFRIFTLLMVLLAIMFLAYAEYIGAAISIILGTLLTFSYQGIQIDSSGKQYMKYDRFLRLKIGRWMPLSTPSYVTIVRINLSSTRNLPSPLVPPSNSRGARAYKVNLVVEGDERYVNICRGRLEDMINEAISLGNYLDIRVLDYTTHEKKWLV